MGYAFRDVYHNFDCLLPLKYPSTLVLIYSLQAIELLTALAADNSSDVILNELVKGNLKSELQFNSKKEDEKLDILNTYWDYLDDILRKIDRLNGFIIYALIPILTTYKSRFRFKYFSQKNITENLKLINQLHVEFKVLIPTKEQIANNINNGIQKEL